MFETYVSYIDFFKETINAFGGSSGRSGDKFVFRNYTHDTKEKDFPKTGAYFGCINLGEEYSGAYSDSSIVVFPSNEEEDQDDKWLIALGIGSLGYKNDYETLSLPGIRRGFINQLTCLGHSFIKNDFLDLNGQDGFKSYCNEEGMPDTLSGTNDKYGSVILACTAFRPSDKESAKRAIKVYLALYGSLIRNWQYTKKDAAKNIDKALSSKVETSDDYSNAKKLLEARKYIVLQGAPGTGKTRLAKKLTSDTSADHVFFTQFHAETTYADFIYGITPVLDKNDQTNKLQYQSNDGALVLAIKKAMEEEHSGKKVYLIIDEINRANLSNVLGQAFYLFEPLMEDTDIEVTITPSLKLNSLPKNLYVIATMNTADRSLAVVDFALRRRFAWYTLYPHSITDLREDEFFAEEQYNKISFIFEKYANDEEINLQPGQAYFIVRNTNQAKDLITLRLRYELMPLIKEYLDNGLLTRAKDDFIDFFRKEIGEEMYK